MIDWRMWIRFSSFGDVVNEDSYPELSVYFRRIKLQLWISFQSNILLLYSQHLNGSKCIGGTRVEILNYGLDWNRSWIGIDAFWNFDFSIPACYTWSSLNFSSRPNCRFCHSAYDHCCVSLVYLCILPNFVCKVFMIKIFCSKRRGRLI